MTDLATRTSLPAISQYRTLRLFTVFILYVAQGAPIGVFFFAVPAWLAMNGASPLAIGGFLSATSLPWTLKFVNGFIMDRFTFLPMGRRRIWLIGAQSIMVAGLILLALINPGAADIAALSAFSFLIMSATTFQDVAIDGMAVDLVDCGTTSFCAQSKATSVGGCTTRSRRRWRAAAYAGCGA